MHVLAIVLEANRKDFLPEQPLRRLPEGGGMVEITVRCLHGRLRPDRKTNEILLGVLGLALVHCPTVKLHGYWFLSNHFNLLATFPRRRRHGELHELLKPMIPRKQPWLMRHPDRVIRPATDTSLAPGPAGSV